MTILGLAESFKTMNRPGPTVTLFDGFFLEKYTKYKSIFSNFMWPLLKLVYWQELSYFL